MVLIVQRRFWHKYNDGWCRESGKSCALHVASCPLQVSRCMLVIYLVLRATVKPNLCKTYRLGAKQTNCREASEGSSPKQMWGVLGRRTGRTGCSLLCGSFHFYLSLFFFNIHEMPQGLRALQFAGCRLHRHIANAVMSY